MLSQKEQQTSMQHQQLHTQQSLSQQASPLQPSQSPRQLQQRQTQPQPPQQIQSEQQQQLQQKSLQPQQLRQPQTQQIQVPQPNQSNQQVLQQTQLPSSQPFSTHTQLASSLQVSPNPVSQSVVNPRLSTASDSISSGPQHSPSTRSTVPQPSPIPPPPSTSQPVNATQWNTATLCKFGQETVIDVVSKAQDIFQTLKNLQPPNGTPASTNISNDKRSKNQEQLRNMRMLFKKLRIIFEKCNDSSQLQGMEYMHIESLIPLREEWDMKYEERKTSESYRIAQDECKDLIDQVQMKSAQLKEIVDYLRRIIWEINTMLTIRKS